MQPPEGWVCQLETFPSVVGKVNAGHKALLIHSSKEGSSLHRVTVGPSQQFAGLTRYSARGCLGYRRARVAFREQGAKKEIASLM